MNSSENNRFPKNSLVFKKEINEKTYEESSCPNGPKTIGQRIKILRKNLGLTQDALAQKMHFENKSRISNYENNKANFSIAVLLELCHHLNTTPNYLLGLEEWDEDLAEIIALLLMNKDPHLRKIVKSIIKEISPKN